MAQEIVPGATALTIPGEMAPTRTVNPAGRMASLAQVVAPVEAEPVVVGQEAAQEAVVAVDMAAEHLQ